MPDGWHAQDFDTLTQLLTSGQIHRRLESVMLRLVATVASYMGLLTLLATASPGVGFLGDGITIVPAELRGWSHVPLYGGLAWLIIYSLRVRGWPIAQAAIVGAAISMLFGLWTELAQVWAPGREPSIEDLLFDGLGIAMAAGLFSMRTSASRTFVPVISILRYRPAALHLDRSTR
jgi:hypothetical protein